MDSKRSFNSECWMPDRGRSRQSLAIQCGHHDQSKGEHVMVTKPIDLTRLATVQLVPLTPFGADGRHVIAEALGGLIRDLFESGIRVFLPGAGTGEFHSLSVQEVLTTVRVTKESVGDKAVVVAPIGFGLGHALALGRGAVELGADALLIMPPVHPYLSDAGVRDYIDALAG